MGVFLTFMFQQNKAEVCEEDMEQLTEIVKRDPLSEISEQEKEMLWKLRHKCQEIPDSLPRLLDVVKWNCRDDVSQVYLYIYRWMDEWRDRRMDGQMD